MYPQKNKIRFGIITCLLVVMLMAILTGAVRISIAQMGAALLHYFHGNSPASVYEAVFLQIRLPRVLMVSLAGAVLSLSGLLMQGLLRNPIVEPGLVGTSAGAALGASMFFVFAPVVSASLPAFLGPFLLPLFAFAGGLIATIMVYQLARNGHQMEVMSVLLVGIAINAIALSGTGLMTYLARDPQARSIGFWNLGTFSGVSWDQLWMVLLVAVPGTWMAKKDARKLNALMLGEAEAMYMGTDINRLKQRILLVNTAMVSVLTAFVGVVGFVGLIVPHLMRLLVGSDHRYLIPVSMLGGALVLSLADLAARLIIAPAEIPIGIITSVVGAPVFIILLKRNKFLQTNGGGDD